MKVLFEPSKRYMREDKALRRILRFPVHDRFCILFDADSVQPSPLRLGFIFLFISLNKSDIVQRENLLRKLSRKEVFQPHLPVRLPCYDFTPVIWLTFGSWLLAVTSLTSGAPNSHGVTGGVYKARERIHRAVADARLLANPASWSRVADSSPN